MSELTDQYAIKGGEEGKKRLNVLSGAMQQSTLKLLLEKGLSAGMNVLDAGCGGGNVSLMMAELVGPAGKITGIDLDAEILALAERDRVEQRVENLQYVHRGIYDAGFLKEFDFVYARFLLSHLNDPLKAVAQMRVAARPGGKVVVEDLQFSGHFSWPENAAFKRYLELYTRTVEQKGGNAELGPQIPGIFRDAGLQDVGFDIIQPAFEDGPGKQMGYITLEKIKQAVINAGVADEQEVDKILRELDAFTKDERTMISMPRIFRVWGTVPS
jgi:ubiquinone/menaquinone biosynthesis C-methylase UbiE